MSQVSLYMDDQTMSLLRDRSQKEGLSISKYVARIVENHVTGKQDAWPTGYWDDVYGCLSDEDAKVMRASLGDTTSLASASDDTCDWFAGNEG